jgi:hypothetical protein
MSANKQHKNQEARDVLQQLLPPTKIIHDDPNWVARSCQFFAVAHALLNLKVMATEFRCNINVYQGFHRVIQRPLGGVEALHDLDTCLITDLHYM